ncbi:LytTR family transcriptional regulator DNA-binding domain-containing protein [Paenibacillus prosopidis]|uniref:LytTr DNA-binding domain-containing protein n=1 Tax=Paenibacillus prosopidis TaxID=630520 RepID=A0A368VT92_9BACL|nr:LytTR family transcriptional regulator DNA-binding domain-containing protein [Paenibacillus prosopidis]RCW44271.1 LytTr DNA-binding domain-containing protein [Paenibacillus prosopidis]
MQAPVIDTSIKNAFMLDMSEATFIHLGANRRDLLFARQSSTLRLVRNIQEMSAALDGTDFLRVNQDIIVNMKRAKYNPKEYTLSFDPSGSEQISSCYVSRDNRSKVKKWFMTY